MTIELRDVRPDELPAVLALNEAAVPHVNAVSRDTMEWFAGVAAYFRVAVEEDRVLAFLIALAPGIDYDSANYRWFGAHYDSFVYVDRIVVGADAQRRGLGRRFYEDLVEFARPHAPVILAEVNTRPRNETSLAFHERFGFEKVGSQDTEGGTKTVVMLVKPLG